jgi:hypothetical protein
LDKAKDPNREALVGSANARLDERKAAGGKFDINTACEPFWDLKEKWILNWDVRASMNLK